MVDRSNEPLSRLEKLVYGEFATRRADGSVREVGSGHDPDVIAHRNRLEPATPAPVMREIDMREIHAAHPTPQ